MKKIVQLSLAVALILFPCLAWGEETVSSTLSLPAYLHEIQVKNGGYRSSVEYSGPGCLDHSLFRVAA